MAEEYKNENCTEEGCPQNHVRDAHMPEIVKVRRRICGNRQTHIPV